MTDPDATALPPGEVSTISGQPSTPVNAPVFGNYRLMQKLGEGGMGEVWAAEQERPMRRKVALKVIKAGMDSREVLARFESERQALALMNHPNIARVFEAGDSSHGRPFFVMEQRSRERGAGGEQPGRRAARSGKVRGGRGDLPRSALHRSQASAGRRSAARVRA